MEKPIKITLARKKTELRQIIALQRANLRETVGEEVAAEQGFVTAVHDPAVLAEMNAATASVVAKDGAKVVGYALTMLGSFATKVPALTEVLAQQDQATYNGQLLADVDYLNMGQVCVAESHRGRRLVDRMYKYMRGCYSIHYPYLVTAVDARNTRSRRVHARIGFKEIRSFHSAETGKDWVIVLWDWVR